jgi:uncharacterized membrane protein
MNENFIQYLRGTMLFITIGVVLSIFSTFTALPFNILEGYGIVMLFVAIKTGYDIYHDG